MRVIPILHILQSLACCAALSIGAMLFMQTILPVSLFKPCTGICPPYVPNIAARLVFFCGSICQHLNAVHVTLSPILLCHFIRLPCAELSNMTCRRLQPAHTRLRWCWRGPPSIGANLPFPSRPRVRSSFCSCASRHVDEQNRCIFILATGPSTLLQGEG